MADEVVTMAATPIDAGTNTVIATGEKAVDGVVLAVAAAGMASKVAISTLMDREAWLLSQADDALQRIIVMLLGVMVWDIVYVGCGRMVDVCHVVRVKCC